MSIAPFRNRVTELFGIQYPILQGGMIWASGWRLAAAVSEAGALGIIGSGSMYPEVLREHIQKLKAATDKPFAVNIPLLYADVEQHLKIVLEEGVKFVVTSAGNPKAWTPYLKEKGIRVAHVVSSSRFAKKAEEAGCDAVIAEGFEAGGHNGREETTTLVLIPAVVNAVKIPVIAAGGIINGRQILATMVMGAEGAQLGTRFVASEEASSHFNFKKAVINSQEGDTLLTMKQLTPVRLLRNKFFQQVQQAEWKGASEEELKNLLGRARAKKGMFEGDLEEGELEIGQASALVRDILPAKKIVEQLWQEWMDGMEDPVRKL
jgi:enoyl-[acyl-carrier protein] reductase II